jgi:glycosyltransferase involved in cell wall biosynthesis
MTALFLSPEAPYPLTGGGALRSASVLQFLARNYELDVILFREPRSCDPRIDMPSGLARRLHVLELPENGRHLLSRAARNAVRLLRRSPPLMDRFAGFGAEIAEAINGQRYDLAVIEHFWCAPYCDQLSAISDATMLDMHNIESVLHDRCARTERGLEALAHRAFSKICRDLEEKWLPRFTYLLAASDSDARELQDISPASRVSVFPNSIPYVPAPPRLAEDVVVFSGNLEYHPNASAVRYFCRDIWPRLRDRWPGLVWRLLGKNAQAVASIVAGDPRIELAGPIDDAIGELARAKVAVVPILAGSGTRIKILEAWAAGVPVVSTSLGAEGLPARDGEHLLLANDAAGFAEAVSSLLANPALAERIGRAGRRLFEREFTWEAAWKSLDFLDPCYHR